MLLNVENQVTPFARAVIAVPFAQAFQRGVCGDQFAGAADARRRCGELVFRDESAAGDHILSGRLAVQADLHHAAGMQ